MVKIYANPKTQYERFVNAFCKIEGWKYGNREKMTQKAAEKWKIIKKDENFQKTVQEYISSAPESKYKQKVLSFTRVVPATDKGKITGTGSLSGNSGANIESTFAPQPESSALSLVVTVPPIPDVLNAVEDPDTNNPSVFDFRRVATFLAEHCPALNTEDVLQNSAFVSTFASSVVIIGKFLSLDETYKSAKQRQRKTALSTDLENIRKRLDDFRKKMENAGDIKLSMSAGTSQLSVQASRKTQLLTELVAIATSILSELEKHSIIERMKKRLAQKEQTTSTVVEKFSVSQLTVQCRNSDTAWLSAYATFEATGGVSIPNNVHVTEIRAAAELIENETFVEYSQLNISDGIVKLDFIDALLTNFPVMHGDIIMS